MKTAWRGITFALSLMLALGACSDEDGNGGSAGNGSFQLAKNAEVSVTWGVSQLRDGSAITINPAVYTVGEEELGATLEIENLGSAALTISSIELTAAPEGAFRLAGADGAAVTMPIKLPALTASGEPASYQLQLLFTRPSGDVEVSGELVLRSNSAGTNDASKGVLTFPLVVDETSPDIRVVDVLQFGNVREGDVLTKNLGITNLGTAPLIVTGFRFDGDSVFSLDVGGQVYEVSAETQQGITLESPLEIAAGEQFDVPVTFEPDGPEEAHGEVNFISNDPDEGASGSSTLIEGNVGGPCVTVTPTRVEFGGRLVGQLAEIEVKVTSCGDADLEISGLQLLTDSDEYPDHSLDFGLDLTALPGASVGQASLTADDPMIVLPAGESATFKVTYLPDELNEVTEDGPVPDLTLIQLVANTFVGERQIEVSGFGVDRICPTAVIKVQEGDEVKPQTKLHLVGSQSFAASGSIAKYEWSVTQPPGSQSVFLPSSSAPDPTFEANVAGSYVFRLRVWDEDTVESCTPAEHTVIVTPDEAIHIELLWHTPADQDETDEGFGKGADLDLHFLHKFAAGQLDLDGDGQPDGWFDTPYDVFWYNSAPDWGSHDPNANDDPSLDRDDTDGAGPENVNLDVPQDGMVYRIGVHYWNDHGLGETFATVRVYVNSTLRFEVNDVELVNHDLWEVATVAWPSGKIEAVCDTPDKSCDDGGGYLITSGYQHPLFLGQ